MIVESKSYGVNENIEMQSLNNNIAKSRIVDNKKVLNVNYPGGNYNNTGNVQIKVEESGISGGGYNHNLDVNANYGSNNYNSNDGYVYAGDYKEQGQGYQG